MQGSLDNIISNQSELIMMWFETKGTWPWKLYCRYQCKLLICWPIIILNIQCFITYVKQIQFQFTSSLTIYEGIQVCPKEGIAPFQGEIIANE
jgi:hypothetical protein